MDEKKNLAVIKNFIRFNGDVFMTVESYSMQPALMPGDKILVKFVPVDDLHRGDIVVYKRDIFIVHRLVGKFISVLGVIFFTKGDKLDKIDSPFTGKKYVGKVVFIVKA